MRVLLVDDHALFAQSLAIVLSDFPSIEQFSNIKSVDEIEATIEREKPDILLMDINLGKLSEEDGLLLAQNLLQKYPNQKIVILSGYNLPVYRKEAKKLGAKGFINKDIEPEELLHILEAINNGSTYFEKDGVYVEELTETEKQVLRMLANGIKRKEIAEQLCKMGFAVDKKQVVLKAPIKTAGRYPVNVKMYAEVAVSVTVVVD